jgi:signal transduction histidine kinase
MRRSRRLRPPRVPRLRVVARTLAGAALCAGLSLATASPADQAAQRPWRVVILMGTDPGLPAMQQHDLALRTALLAAAPRGVLLFTDSIDAYRFDYDAIAPEFLALQRKKYAGHPVDLVIGVGDRVATAARDQRDALWPGVPLVLAAVEGHGFDAAAVPSDTSVITWDLGIEDTLDMVQALQPDARRLIVVGGSDRFDIATTQRIERSALRRGAWQVEAWGASTVDRIGARLAQLGPDTAVVFGSYMRDANGPSAFPGDTVARLARASTAPVYGLFATQVGRGLVAGSVVDFEQLGRRAGEIAAARLAGRSSAGSTEAVPGRCRADHDPIRRHGLPILALPVGCEVINPPRNLWTEYRGFVLAAGAIVALQAATIGGLLLQRRRRRQAEDQSRQRALELSRAMRFAAMGELTASIAHEINQPLGAILANADAADLMLRGGPVPAEALRSILADIRRDDLRATEVIRRLRTLLENHDVEQARITLHPLLEDAIAIIEPEARRRGITIERDFAATDDRLCADPVQVQQVLINLSMNAMDAMESPAATGRRLTVATTDADGQLELRVADQGAGIAPLLRERIFESFYTTKPRGMGLGLPIVRAIVEAHRGRLLVEAREGGGSVFVVRLPRQADATARDGVPQRALQGSPA